ncbi:hypothetical protein B0H17DRAFT_1128597 [Mycena rosella]|uniref:Uncharacterized protein n=1 Tax=Mycena rosella TaxID=1033263 RepID=A0AAD7GLT5_MYCRO|nr:hypothetical protein B0H17DRAFT_1128597 [Mycena rosella]
MIYIFNHFLNMVLGWQGELVSWPLPSRLPSTAPRMQNAQLPVLLKSTWKSKIRMLEAANKTSITQTCVGTLDVRAPLKVMWVYSEDEVAQLIHAPELLAAVGPLPLYLLKVITQHKTATALLHEKERVAKEAAKAMPVLLGSMKFTHTHEKVVIPTIFLVSVRHWIPLHWWTDCLLRKANENPHIIEKVWSCVEQATSYAAGEKVHVVDITKSAKHFEGEDKLKALTPSLWRQASTNLLACFKDLCPPIDPNNPDTHNFASDYALH